MSAPKGFRPFHRAATATKLGVTINANTGHLMFNTLAKRELLDLLDADHTEELTFFFDNESNRIYMRPARTNEGERGWKLNPNNGMVSAAMVRNWMLEHGYEPSIQYSLIAHEHGWMIEPETTTVQSRTRRAHPSAPSHTNTKHAHIHLDRIPERAVA
jgi:hypothetical protein